MRTLVLVAAACALAPRAQATVWPAQGNSLAGGAFTVAFLAPPPGNPALVYTAPIVAGGAGLGTATIVPDPIGNPANQVILTVAGDTWTATWTIDNRIQTIDFARIDLAGSVSVFDDGTLPSSPGSALGLPYTFVSLTGGGGDPVMAAAYGGAGPAKNVGDLHDDLTLTFVAGAFTTAPGTPEVLSFMTDTDRTFPPGTPLACTSETLGLAFCDASDGALAFCPCGNLGDPDSGCDIAQGTGGVRLCVTEKTGSLATLVASGFPPAAAPTAIVIRSSRLQIHELPPDNHPFVLGDGVRCISTFQLVRLAATTAQNGVSTHAITHPAMAGPGTFYYQVWFRNTPATYCTTDAFNVSGGRSLVW